MTDAEHRVLRLGAALSASLAGVVLACAIARPPSDTASLRKLADRCGFAIGAAASDRAAAEDRAYAAILAREFNALTPENVMQFGVVQPERGRYDFAAADRLVAFAEANGMAVRGHALVWHLQLPGWLEYGTWSKPELVEILRSHVRTVMGRYGDRVRIWDVVNEALANDGTLRPSFWLDGIGPEYLELAFRFAHEANPEARLFYNEQGAEGLWSKADGLLERMQRLRSRGVPIHGVGLQMHVSVEPGSAPPMAEFAANLARLGALGLEVHVSELDVRIPDARAADARVLEQQATIYGGVLAACLEAPACTGLWMWGFTDAISWIPAFFPGHGSALPFDGALRPKPAFRELARTLAARCR